MTYEYWIRLKMNEVNRGKLEKNERGSDKKESRKIKTRRIEKTEKKNNK